MCTVNNSIFREYDIRGIADEDLTDEAVEMIGLAFGSTIIDHGLEKISIGRDCRKSSNRIFDALSKGISVLKSINSAEISGFFFSTSKAQCTPIT